MIGRVPPLRMQPRLFSSRVESPPALLPGVGCPALLAADPLDGFAHHGCRTHVDEDVAQFTDGRVAGDTGGCVGAAALDAEEELGGVEPLLGLHRSFRSHVSRRADRLLDGLERAAFLLNTEGDNRLAGHGLDLFSKLFVGNRLAAEADDDHAVDVRITCKAREDFLAHGGVRSDVRAACVEDDVHGTADLACYDPAALAAAGAGRKDQHVVADAGSSFSSSVAEELESLEIRSAFGLLCAHPEFGTCHLAVVISGDAEQVVMGDPVTFCDRFGCVTEALIVLDDLAVLRNVRDGDLVAVGDVFLGCKRQDLVSPAVGDCGTFRYINHAGYDVIG